MWAGNIFTADLESLTRTCLFSFGLRKLTLNILLVNTLVDHRESQRPRSHVLVQASFWQAQYLDGGYKCEWRQQEVRGRLERLDEMVIAIAG